MIPILWPYDTDSTGCFVARDVVAEASRRPFRPSNSKKLLKRPIDLLGKTVGRRYRVDAVIGSGGMGTIYLASDVLAGRAVAIKALHAASFSAANFQRLRREARAAVAARSELVCRIEYLGVHEGTPYIVMEHLRGETLRVRLRAAGPLEIDRAVAVMHQLLAALDRIHAAGVLHRDVKPGNVFMTSRRDAPPRMKLIDFGLARLLPGVPSLRGSDEERESSITGTDAIPGTPPYLSPEQLDGAKDLDQRVDLWAAGLTFYEMLAGRRAYDGASLDQLAVKIAFEPPPRLRDIRPEVPPAVEQVVRKALAKKRADRFSTAAAFSAALREAWDSSPFPEVGEAVRPEAPTLSNELLREPTTDLYLPPASKRQRSR